jgi:HEPN domain-containing protein
MNRSDFIKLTELRLHEAKVLLDAEKFDGAYYLCGYIVECALKACIANKTREYDFPDLKLVKDSHTHNLVTLMELSGLKSDFDKEIKRDTGFRDYWSVVKDWNEISRYECHENNSACALYQAVADEEKGVLQWIKQRW